MKTTQLLKISLVSIIANKLRTVLSMLGIVIGVITIMLVNAIGTWARQQVDQQFKNLSVNTILVFPNRWLTLKLDAIDLIQQLPQIDKVAWFFQTNTTISNETYSSSFGVIGVTPSMFDVVSLKKLGWDLITSVYDKDKVVVLGNGVFTQLYPDQKPTDVIGSFLKINKKEFTIVGILDKAWWSFGPLSFDESVYVPINAFERYLVTRDPSLRIAAIAKSTDVVAKAVESITNALYEAYKIDSSNSNSLRVIDAWWSVATAQANANMLSMLLIGIASIVFVVSGIGIMNVMFASVAERTKEIGILKSIWASQWSVMWQFLFESLLLTWFASLLGVIIWETIIISNILGSWLPMVRSNLWDLIAVTFAMATWLFFWWYPAWRASRLDPVDALRS